MTRDEWQSRQIARRLAVAASTGDRELLVRVVNHVTDEAAAGVLAAAARVHCGTTAGGARLVPDDPVCAAILAAAEVSYERAKAAAEALSGVEARRVLAEVVSAHAAQREIELRADQSATNN